LNRNPNAIDTMAINNPYTSSPRHDISHVNEYKKIDDRLASTSVFPVIKQLLDDHIEQSNQIIITNDVENANDNDVQLNKNCFLPSSSEVNSSLFNQQNNDLFPKSSDISFNINQQIISMNKQKIKYNGSFVSHIPNMSSSSSSSSNSALNEQTIGQSQGENDPRTRSIAVGQETLIEIDREQSGLGLSVVGGSDTQLVRKNYSVKIIKKFVVF